MQNALPEAAVERFRTTVERLTSQSPGLLGVAVSGGADSLALMLLCHAAFPERVRAATVDHGLRSESAGEAGYVGSVCRTLRIPHETLALTASPDGNVSDWARRERYAVLDRWARQNGIAFVMTGHHADDQLETLVMRLNRGAGIGGLAGIRPRNGTVVRPLLDWRRHELESIVAVAGLEPVDDPTNRDDRFDRARLRKMLKSADWLDPIAATRSAAALADAEAALEWAATAYFGRRVADRNGIVSFDHRDLPAELLRRLTLRCLRAVAPEASPRGDEIDRLMDGLLQGRVATLANVRCSGGDFWLFAPAPPRRKN
jgi:tRNA(Ile)-lysidine synthase